MRGLRLAVLAIAVGTIGRLLWEYGRYKNWDSLEAEVETWRESPRGRFNAYLDGLD